ncbi:MAG: DUF4293 domain-containing protein, partial [Muribaculaceae bacterium]|nr:DUF4293 domain-containing protein [Muribaculaceae bacterium]
TMVIQRWQSVLLLVAAVMMGVFTFGSLAQVQTLTDTFNYVTSGFYQEGELANGNVNEVVNTWYCFIISIATAILFLLDIFLFKNLPLQKKVCAIGILFTIASVATAVTGVLCADSWIGAQVTETNWNWQILVCSPALALIASIMAYGRIQKDHNLLKSVDRIR